MSDTAVVVIREVAVHGSTKYLAGVRAAGKSRVSSFCRHYHDSEAEARRCPSLGELRLGRWPGMS